ncbi:MAG: IPT/TIG domain-containing protein [Dehalococcoidia bacterium]|nr:IPT/TIG domain-containing protein [Myxococcales bacterium]MCA9857268.1 IPT/TIG domain-containing protein [Dehalococcoidia bacterium]
MALPTLSSVQPTTGPSSGGDLVRLVGTDFADRVRVLFGGVAAEAPSVRDEAGLRLVDLRTPVHAPGVVGVELQNLDAAGVPVPGESVVLVGAYRFARPTVAREADLTRVVRQLLRELKRQVLANVSATVSVDYDDTTLDGLNLIAMAKVPSLVLSGPTLRPNRFYSANVAHEDVVDGIAGPELARRKPPYTVDLVFTLTAASERTAELFNLMAVVATFLNRNRWLELQRDPADASRGSVRWELDADGEFRTQLAGKDDVRAFTCGVVVRGFDVDEGLPLDLGKRVTEPELLPTQAIAPGGAP